jgi:hypothetical protein
MIELTEPFQRALDNQPNEPLQVVDPRTKQTYVLLRNEEYERMKEILDEDDGLDMRQVAVLIAEAMREDDEQDPLLESYQKYRNPE